MIPSARPVTQQGARRALIARCYFPCWRVTERIARFTSKSGSVHVHSRNSLRGAPGWAREIALLVWIWFVLGTARRPGWASGVVVGVRLARSVPAPGVDGR
jgi:hypothetical protein